MGMRAAVRSLGVFFIVEFFIVVMALLLMGPADASGINHPLAIVQAAVDSIGITVGDLAVGLFVFMTFVNFIIFFISFIRR